MLAKMITVVVFAAAVGAVLLGLRQQRLQLMHEMTRMHAQMNGSRQDTWDLQVKIAERTQPTELREAITRLNLELEPITPADPGAGWPGAVAEAPLVRD